MEIGWYLKTIGSAMKRSWKENALRLSLEEWWLNMAIENARFSLHETLSLKHRFIEEGVEKPDKPVEIPTGKEEIAAIRAKIEKLLDENARLRKALSERREDVRELRALRIIEKTRRKALKLGVISLPKPEEGKGEFYMHSRVTGYLRLDADGLKQVRKNIRDERNARLEPLMSYAEVVAKLSPVVAALLGLLVGLLAGSNGASWRRLRLGTVGLRFGRESGPWRRPRDRVRAP